MGLGKLLKRTFGKKKSSDKAPKPPKPQTLDMFGVTFGLGANGGIQLGSQELDPQTPTLDEAHGGLGAEASNTFSSMLQAGADIAYNADSPLLPSWAEPEVEGLGSSGIGLGLSRLANLGGNELRRGPSVVDASNGNAAVNEVESAHTTHMVELAQEIGIAGSNRGVFKADPETEGAEASTLYGIGQEAGNSRMAARAVASARLDRALGMNQLSQDTFATMGGEQGVLSPLVEGQALGYGAEGKILDVDKDDETFKRTLCDLQFQDFLSGQVDRHNANIFVGPDGSVKGIDNDMAFGTQDLFRETLEEKGHQIKSMPKHVDAGTAERFMGMDETQFLTAISGREGDPDRLNEDEIGAALDRYWRLQDHVSELAESGGLVDDWSTVHGDDDAFQMVDGKGEGHGWASYLDRVVGYDHNYSRDDQRVAHDTKAKRKKGTRADLFA